MTRLFRKTAAALALFTIELVFALGVYLACIMVFYFLARDILQGQNLTLDAVAFTFTDYLTTNTFTTVITVITFFASRNFITAAALTLIFYFLFVRKHKWYSLRVPVIALGSILLNLILKFFFNRPRPLLPHLVPSSGLSFPSGHAMVSASFYGLLIYLVHRHVTHKIWRIVLIILLAIFILLIGFSRVYLHVHYASDVLAGWAAGLLWVMLAIHLLERVEQYYRRKVNPLLKEDKPEVKIPEK